MFIRSMLCVFALTAVSSAQSTTPMLDTGIPNLFFPPPALITGASSTDPLLGSVPPGTTPSTSQPCGTSNPPCVLTSQYNNTGRMPT